jgi:elongation factor 1-gamma
VGVVIADIRVGGLQVEQMAILASKRAFECLNKHLAARTYVVGHSVTIADIILTCNLLFPFEQVLTKEFTANYPHVERYFWTMVNQPSFKKVVGKINQTDGPLPPPPSKGEAQAPVPAQVHPQAHGRHTHKEKVSKQKKETPKPAEAPKPVEAPKPLENDDEEETPVKKSKNPLDFLPPSPMVMDNWKRLYSNTKAKDFHLAINGINDLLPFYEPLVFIHVTDVLKLSVAVSFCVIFSSCLLSTTYLVSNGVDCAESR